MVHDYSKTGGKHRPSNWKGVRAVESIECPGRDGNHWLINRGYMTECRGCGVTWAELDAALREAS